MAQGQVVAVTSSDGAGTWSVTVTEDRTGVPRGTVGAISAFSITNNSTYTILVWWILASDGSTQSFSATPGTNVQHDFHPIVPAGTLKSWGVN